MNASKFIKDTKVFEQLEHPEKYSGAKKQITTRSRWEKSFIFRFLEPNKNVLEWSSEDIIIPYYSDLDQKMHRYFPDFWFKHKNGKEYIVEVKPWSQLSRPKVPKRRTRSYYDMCEQYIKNQAKFEAAMSFCKKLKQQGRDISFQIVTEKELYG